MLPHRLQSRPIATELKPDAIILLPHGTRARWNEFVTLSGQLKPKPAPFEVTQDDLIVALTHLAVREGMPKEALRAPYLNLTQQNSVVSFSVTAEFAQILLEGETALIHSANPDKTFRYVLEISLLDSNASRFRSDLPELSADLRTEEERQNDREAAAHTRAMVRAQRQKEDERTFRLFATLPAQIGRMSESFIQEVEDKLISRIQGHFGAASVRAANQKTEGGRQKGDYVFYVCPYEEVKPTEFIRTKLNQEHARGYDCSDPILTEIKFIDVGTFHPVVMRISKQLRAQLHVQGCCFRHQCIPSLRRSCSRMDDHYDLKRSAAREARWEASLDRPPTFREQREEAKRQRLAEAEERQRQEGLHHQSLIAQDREASFCRAWLLGRCSRDHPHLHGTPEESAEILCCSVRLQGAPGYSESRTECPYARFSDRVCIYAHAFPPCPEDSD